MTMLLNRLNCPCFDLVWVVLSKEDGNKHPVAIVCGGGGATKSGVKNQLQIMEYAGENGFELVQSLETGDKLCCGLSTATIKNDVIVCVSVDGSCVVYTCNLDANGKVGFTKRAEFVADFRDNFGSVNCTAAFLDHKNRTCVLTGGDEGVCRLWVMETPDATSAGTPWEAKLLRDFKGHKGPVMAVSIHPTKPWFCSGSRDGTFKVWDISADSTSNIADVQLADGTPGADISKKLECRGCEFSADGQFAFVIQSGRAGATHLVKWSIDFGEKVKDGKPVVSLIPIAAVMCSKVPATRLRINGPRELIVIGSSDGMVSIFRMSNLSKISTHAAHDMPVTGLSFCPVDLSVDAARGDQKCYVLSCSVDYRLASVDLDARTPILKYLFFFLIFLLFAGILGFGIVLHFDTTKPVIIA